MNRLLMSTILAAANKLPSVCAPTLKSKRWDFLSLLSLSGTLHDPPSFYPT